MCRVLLLLLLLAALNSADLPEDSTGREFLVAFPENIAYYHPDPPQNKIQITALYAGTQVTINSVPGQILGAGQTLEVPLDVNLELNKQNISTRIVKITSTKNITVCAVNLRNNSMQTGLVIPTDKLDKEYLIPPVPTIAGTTDRADMVTTDVTERNPFKLIIINTNQKQVTVDSGVPNKVVLQPSELAQIWVTKGDALQAVKADQPVVVLFGHTCANRNNCTCGLLYTRLQPARQQKVKFYIPPALVGNAGSKTFVLVSEKESTRQMAFDSNSPMVETDGTAVLYCPGLLLNLIAETDFAACHVINSIADAKNFAVIVVHKDATDGVHVGSQPLASSQWQELKGTDYVSTQYNLASGKNVIWHASSLMAVYLFGTKGDALFGNPAPIISTIPDFRGCTLSPEVIKIGEVARGWRESVKYCRDNNLTLVTFPNAQLAQQIYNKIIQAKDDSLQEVWIGMRMSSQNGEWYWLDKTPVNYTNWAEGEPGTMRDGQCAIMSLKSKTDFGWADDDCCKAARPVCYGSPVLLPM